MTESARRLPSRELRDTLLCVDFADDPRPPECDQHSAPGRTKNVCELCHATLCWRMRMLKRFHKRGLILALDDRVYDVAPQPPPCPDGHSNNATAAVQGCEPCRLLRNWRQREYQRLHKAGESITSTDDWDALRHHVKLLHEVMSTAAIARAAGCGITTILKLLRDSTAPYPMGVDLTKRILAVPVPPTRPALQLITNPVGVYRRLRAMAWDGNGPRQVAPFIGENIKTVTGWLHGQPAPAYMNRVLDAALEQMPTPGPDTAIAARARRQGWAPALAWHDLDIDNPNIRPRVDVRADFRKTDHPLYSQVFQAVCGLIPKEELLRAEKISVVRILHRAGWSDRRIAEWLRWSDTPADGIDAVGQFRRRWKINGCGAAVHLWGGNRDANDHIVRPAA